MLQITFLKQIYVCPSLMVSYWSNSSSGMLHNPPFLFIHHFLILPHIVHRPPALYSPHTLAIPIYSQTFTLLPCPWGLCSGCSIWKVLPSLIFLLFSNVSVDVLLILLGQHFLICTTQIPKGPRGKIKGMSQLGLKKNYVFIFTNL